MPDREKVIKGLTAIQDEAYDRWVHQQYIEDPLITLIKENISDALALLREQEPVKPTWRQGLVFCGKCGRNFGRGFKCCPDCGRAVKWDEADRC